MWLQVGQTPTIKASRHNNCKVLHYLIDKRADMNIQDEVTPPPTLCRIPTHCAASPTPCAASPWLRIAVLSAVVGQNGWSALFWAAQSGSTGCVKVCALLTVLRRPDNVTLRALVQANKSDSSTTRAFAVCTASAVLLCVLRLLCCCACCLSAVCAQELIRPTGELSRKRGGCDLNCRSNSQLRPHNVAVTLEIRSLLKVPHTATLSAAVLQCVGC